MSQSPKVDKRIVEALENPNNSDFTVRKLRDQYAETHWVPSHQHSLLRKFIYREIKKLRRSKLIEMDEKRRKRNQLYHVTPAFSRDTVDASGEAFEEWQLRQKEVSGDKRPGEEALKDLEHSESAVDPEDFGELEAFLEDRLKKIKSEFLETMGKSEEFKLLSEGFPSIPKLAEEFQKKHAETREQSLRLLGRIEAIEDVKKLRNYAY